MIKLERLEDKTQINDPLAEKNSVVVAKNGLEIIGYCVYDDFEICSIIKVFTSDLDSGLIDGLIRTAMFIAGQKGCYMVNYSEEIDTKLLLEYGLLDNESLNLRTSNIEKILTSECKGKC